MAKYLDQYSILVSMSTYTRPSFLLFMVDWWKRGRVIGLFIIVQNKIKSWLWSKWTDHISFTIRLDTKSLESYHVLIHSIPYIISTILYCLFTRWIWSIIIWNNRMPNSSYHNNTYNVVKYGKWIGTSNPQLFLTSYGFTLNALTNI